MRKINEYPKTKVELERAEQLAALVYPKEIDFKRLKADLDADKSTWRSGRKAQRKSAWAMWASWLALALAYAKKPKAAAKFRKRCKKAGVSANANTSIEALIGKWMSKGSRALMHKYSLAVRGAIILGITPEELRSGKHGKVPLTLKYLIDAFKGSLAKKASSKVAKPQIAWARQALDCFPEISGAEKPFVLLLKTISGVTTATYVTNKIKVVKHHLAATHDD
ncbi:hypothetical protein [Ferrovibrio sp.]|uniref:hypothetical protein n=1 Tax=Ferrovibrio sp. TaxID=1917215 RepID=UPI000CBAEE9E|nr:hypothetical protein [Ferrovibrio sp.]PJI42172.1 MAG: hypothetical protein CTR53_06960 [Ferrovibrio sp.]